MINKKKILEEVNSLLLEHEINKYPLDIYQIFKNIKNCEIVPYRNLMQKFKLSLDEAIRYCGSRDGSSNYDAKKNKCLIFFNNFTTNERQLWTLAHELGHLILKHHINNDKTKLFRNSLSALEYQTLEEEANFFAGLLLAHPIILNALNIKTEKKVKEICNISNNAAKFRYQYFKRWQLNPINLLSNILVLNSFSLFIHQKYCSYCHSTFINNSPHLKFCPFCGSDNLTFKGGKTMYEFTKLEVDSLSKCLTCPTCSNDIVYSNDESKPYCKICGTYLVNHCTQTQDDWIEDPQTFNMIIAKHECGKFADGSARFCIYCGSTTTFYVNSLLTAYKDELASYENQLIEDDLNDTKIPF